MNPSKSRVGFFIFLLAAAFSAPGLAAAAEMVAIKVAESGQVFYIPKDKLEALKPNESADLFLDAAGAVPAEAAQLEKDAADKLVVNFLGKKGDKDDYKAYVASAEPVQPADLAPPAADSPEDKLRKLDADMKAAGIAEEIRGIVLASPGVPLDNKLAVALALKALKLANAASYEKLLANEQEGIEEFLVLAAQKAKAGEAPAAIAAAMDGLLAPLTAPIARSRGEVPDAAGVALADDDGTPAKLKHVLNALEGLLNAPEAQRHVAERFARYLKSKPAADLIYFDPTVARDERKVEAAADAAKAWWMRLLATRNGRGEAAILYYVMGEDGNLPPGADAAEGAALLQALKHPPELIEAYEKPLAKRMLRFTADSASIPAAMLRRFFHVGPYKDQDISVWLGGYFNFAVRSAREIFMETRTKREVLDSIAKYELPDSSVQAPPGEETRDRLDFRNTSVRAFGFSDLYEEPYARVVEVPVPGKEPGEPGCCRRLSLRVYTSREKDKYGQWVMKDKLGIFDITNGRDVPPKIYGRRFAFNGEDGKLKDGVLNGFRLDDRRPDSLKYDLSIQNGRVTLAGTGRGGGGGVGVGQLFALRNKQLKEQGYAKKIGKETFWVVGQGGRQGTLLYFKSRYDQSPTLLAGVSEMSGGKSSRIPGDRWLGVLKSSAGADEHWYLRWNDEKTHYDYVKGPPYDPAKDPAATPGAPATPAPTTPTTPTTPADPRRPEPATSTPQQPSTTVSLDAVARCDAPADRLNASTFEKVSAAVGNWSIFYNINNDAQFVLCVYGQKTLFFVGSLVEGGIKKETKGGVDYLLVDYASTSEKISKSNFEKGQVKESRLKELKFAQRHKVYIPVSNLSETAVDEAITAANNRPPDPYLAAVEVIHTLASGDSGKPSQMNVFLRGADKDAGLPKRAVTHALSHFGDGTALVEDYRKGGAGRWKSQENIDKFVEAEAQKYFGKSDFPGNASFDIQLEKATQFRALSTWDVVINPTYPAEAAQRGQLGMCGQGRGTGDPPPVRYETEKEHREQTLH